MPTGEIVVLQFVCNGEIGSLCGVAPFDDGVQVAGGVVGTSQSKVSCPIGVRRLNCQCAGCSAFRAKGAGCYWKRGREKRSEERRVGKECRSRWSTYH